jgi:hypothetical protein
MRTAETPTLRAILTAKPTAMTPTTSAPLPARLRTDHRRKTTDKSSDGDAFAERRILFDAVEAILEPDFRSLQAFEPNAVNLADPNVGSKAQHAADT